MHVLVNAVTVPPHPRNKHVVAYFFGQHQHLTVEELCPTFMINAHFKSDLAICLALEWHGNLHAVDLHE